MRRPQNKLCLVCPNSPKSSFHRIDLSGRFADSLQLGSDGRQFSHHLFQGVEDCVQHMTLKSQGRRMHLKVPCPSKQAAASLTQTCGYRLKALDACLKALPSQITVHKASGKRFGQKNR